MKKRIAFRKLNRTPSHKWSMMRNMVSSLIEHERIVTTVAKAKEIRHLADQMVTLAKKGGSLQHQHGTGDNSGDDDNNNNSVPVQQDRATSTYLHHRRRAAAIVRGDDTITKLFEVLGPRYQHREGGYTRVLKLAKPRHGDHAPMAIIEYVDRPGEIRAARPPPKTLSDMLQEMGISSVDELVTSEEKEIIAGQLEAAADDDADDDDDGEDNDNNIDDQMSNDESDEISAEKKEDVPETGDDDTQQQPDDSQASNEEGKK